MLQHTQINQRDYSWRIDATAAASAAAWVAAKPHVWQADLQGMATYFPHWLLVGGRAGRPLQCATCHAPIVPLSAALRCLLCQQPHTCDNLFWVGQIPALARPETHFQQRQADLRQAGFAEVTIAQQTYLLVPLTVSYPQQWPNQEPLIAYSPRWLRTLGLPTSSAAHHLISNGRACIFGYADWVAQPIHSVLGQRMLNHITSLLKIAAGQSPAHAFIGRSAH